MSSRRSQRLAATLESRWPDSPPGPPDGQSYQSSGGGPTRRPGDLKHQPVTEILQRAAGDSKALATGELQLAKTEITAKLKTAGKGAGLFGVAGAIAFFAVGALTAAFILALALVMPAWAAALVVTGAYGAVAGVCVLMGKQAVKQATPFAPERTLQTLSSLIRKLQSAWERGESSP